MLGSGCRTTPQNPSLELVRRSQPLLGTFVTISAYGPDRAALSAAVTAAFDEFHRADELMSIHRPDSELSRLNERAGGGEEVVVSDELFTVLSRALEIARRTQGGFDPTIRPVADLWGFIWKEHRQPSSNELQTVLPLVGYKNVRAEATSRSVRFLRRGVSLDFGGIGKGYAVDRALARLHAHGITNALVKAGGDLRVSGCPPGRSDWIVQIEDPRRKGRRARLRLRDAALSTSGDYENFFELEGRRYGHILDPRTGMPVREIAACTVVAPTCLESDAWATACIVYGAEESLRDFGDEFALRFVVNVNESGRRPLRVLDSPEMRRMRR